MSEQTNIQSDQLITSVPAAEELAGDTKAVTPDQEPIVTGPRQTGSYELPNGNTVHHEITADGMKQVRVSNSRPAKTWSSAAEFHAANGVATQAELDHVNGNNTSNQSLVARTLGKLGLRK